MFCRIVVQQLFISNVWKKSYSEFFVICSTDSHKSSKKINKISKNKILKRSLFI